MESAGRTCVRTETDAQGKIKYYILQRTGAENGRGTAGAMPLWIFPFGENR